MDVADLADACQALAETLDNLRAAYKYGGPQAVKLGELSANLSAQASTLRTLVVADAITDSTDAVAALKDGTAAANDAGKRLTRVESAIQIAGQVLTFGAAVISENPGAVITAASGLISAVKTLPT